MPARAYDRLTVDGRTINRRTRNMLRAAADLLGVPSVPITQGSYNAGGVSASAGTHDGGGVVDAPAEIDGRNPHRIVWALRTVGFAAWHRTSDQGPWGAHIHAVAIGDRDLAPVAARQVLAYRDGLNGLSSGALDDGPRVEIRTWEQVKALPPVSVSALQHAAEVPEQGAHPWQVKRVKRALGMARPNGKWTRWARRRHRARFGRPTPTRYTLGQLSPGRFLLID